MTIKAKLFVCLGLLTLALLAIGGSGFMALRIASESARILVVDRVEPLKELRTVGDLYAVGVVDTAHKIRSGEMSFDAGDAAIGNALTTAASAWARFRNSVDSDEETQLAIKFEKARATSSLALESLRAIIRGKDQAALESFISKRLYPAIDPLAEPLTTLVDYQIASAKKEYAREEASTRRSFWIMGVLALLSLGIVGYAVHTTARGVISPILAMRDAMRRLADGDLEITIPGEGRKDEIGGMAAAVAVFRDNGIERQQLEAAQKAEQSAKERRAQAVDRLITNFDRDVASILETVSSASTELEATATALSSTAEKSAANAMTVAAASEQATANVSTVASASEELAASISEISVQVESSLKITETAMRAADETDATVKGLVDSAERIGLVVSLISDIASQTNLLALNATIEAARAGEAGRGFAVVATEVKSLAGQTAKATDEISAHIQEMQTVTSKAASDIRSIANVIKTINGTAAAIAAAVTEQGAATQDIARNVNQAADGTQSVSQNIVGVTEGASQTGAGASQVLSAAEELARQSAALKSKVETFFREIKAA